MVREGLNAYISDSENDYSDLFGEKTVFRHICSVFVKKVVSGKNWFAFHTRASDKQIDILKIESDSGERLGTLLNRVCPYNSINYKMSIYKYLLAEFMCYIEYPIVRRNYQSSDMKNSYEKLLVTSNINVVAEWMGMSLEEARMAYGSKLHGVDEDNECNMFPYVKLYSTKDGERKVTRPRSLLDLGISGLRLVPVFALKAGVDELYKLLLKDSYSVSFIKDSGQERSINTTFDKDHILSYYKGNEGYVNRNFESVYGGSFINNPNLDRGYMRVFELGASIYDSATRSINYARISSITQEEPNMAYAHIDLSKVVSTFEDCVSVMSCEEVVGLVELLEGMEVGSTRRVGASLVSSPAELLVWVKSQETLLSTVFLRDLALFMIGFPDLFEGYTGAGKNPSITSAGDLELPADVDDDLDFM